MKEGTVSKIFDYYFGREKYKAEIDRGLKEFFNKDKDSVMISVDAGVQPYFMEWMMYEFDFKNGRKMIEDYCELNPYKMNMVDLAECKCLTKSVYGFFEILKVDEGTGVEVKNPFTGEVFYVREVSLTYQVKPGFLITGRVCKMFDHYEFIGSDSLSLGKMRGIENFSLKEKERLTPKEIYHSFIAPRMLKNKELEEDLSLEEAEKRLAEIFKKSILGKHISMETIKKWFRELPDEDYFPCSSKITKMIMDLLVLRGDSEEEYLDEIIKLIVVISNNTPNSRLDDKTPMQMINEVGEEYEPDMVLTKSNNQTDKIVIDFVSLMNSGKMQKAFEKIDDFFKKAQEEYYVSPEVFRLYSNFAVCYFYLGKYEEGWEALGISLKLNPKYDFGLDLLEKFKDLKKFKFSVGKKKRKSQAIKYYEFLKNLGINYETEEITDSKRFTIKKTNKKKIKK